MALWPRRPALNLAVATAAIATAAFAAASARAEGADKAGASALDICTRLNGVTIEQHIAACTAVIETRGETAANRALAYGHRGLAYHNSYNKAAALRDYEESVRLDSTSASAHRFLGSQHLLKAEYDLALAELDQAIALDPGHPGSFSARGNVYFFKRDHIRALADYNEAIRLDPGYATPLANRGRLQLARNDSVSAIADVNAAVFNDPLSENAWVGRVYVNQTLNKFDSALANASEIVKLDPKLAMGFVQRSYAYYRRGNYTQAARDLEAALQREPENVPALAQHGEVLWTLGKLEAAENDLNAAIELDPQYPNSYWARCGVRTAIGKDLPGALADCETEMRLRRTPDKTTINQAYAFLKSGDSKRAIAAFDKLLKDNPRNAWYLYGRNLAKMKEGDADGASIDLAAAKQASANIDTYANMRFGLNP